VRKQSALFSGTLPPKDEFVSRIEQWIHHARSTVEVREVSEPNLEDSKFLAKFISINQTAKG